MSLRPPVGSSRPTLRDLLRGFPAGPGPGRLAHHRDFSEDFHRTAASLEVSDEARRLAPGVLDPPVPAVARPVVAALAWITAGLLPEPIRRGYGIAWSDADERGLQVVTPAMRTVVRLLPDRARRWPHAREADRRAARAGRRPSHRPVDSGP